MSRRGQSLVELAVALPAVLALAIGSAAIVRLADAKSGLDGATAAAVADAARQVNRQEADACGQQRFKDLVAAYPVTSAGLRLSGNFARGSMYHATAAASVSLSFVPLWFLPRSVVISSSGQALIEPWRSHAGQKCGIWAVAT